MRYLPSNERVRSEIRHVLILVHTLIKVSPGTARVARNWEQHKLTKVDQTVTCGDIELPYTSTAQSHRSGNTYRTKSR